MPSRPHFDWKLRTRSLALGVRTLVMGIVNVTPDSFSDGGQLYPHGSKNGEQLSHASAIAHALRLLDEGADILDIGGESTRPGKKHAVSAQDRVLPVITDVLTARPDAIISIDTYKASTAAAAVAAGAEIVNDVSALQWDVDIAATCSRLHCGVVLMHTRGTPEQWRTLPRLDGDALLELVKQDLAGHTAMASRAGLQHDAIVLDPGYGFGKNFEENYPLLARLRELHLLGYPLLSGPSRKSFIGRTLARDGKDAPTSQRLYGTLATIVASVLQGAHIVRVHDVKPAVEACQVADATLNAQ